MIKFKFLYLKLRIKDGYFDRTLNNIRLTQILACMLRVKTKYIYIYIIVIFRNINLLKNY